MGTEISESDVHSRNGFSRTILRTRAKEGKLECFWDLHECEEAGTRREIEHPKYHERSYASPCLDPSSPGIGDAMLRHGELLRRTLLDGNLQWLCYLSSTGVYGHCAGAWVDENYPAKPTSELAKLRLDAEVGWLNLGHDLGAVDTIIKQEPLSEGQKMRKSRQFTSRVHVEDICQALKAGMYMPSFGKIYNIVDDGPAPREQVFAYALELIEKKWSGHIKQNTSFERTKLLQKGSSRGEK